MPKSKNSVRPDGRIKSKIYLGNGKYKYVYARTQKELDAKIIELRIQYNKGIDLSASRDTFLDWAKMYLQTKKYTLSNARYKNAEQIVNVKLADLHTAQITKIRTAEIQNLIYKYADEGYSTSVLSDIKGVIKHTMQLAIDNRVMDFNPAEHIVIPKNQYNKQERRALTEEEQSWIENTEHRAQTAAMIMLHAGLRRGELIPLTWSDIDLDKCTIRVNKAVEILNNKPNLKHTTKTKAGIRTIHIPNILVEFLKNKKSAATSLFVCPSSDGRMMTDTSFRRMWSSYLSELNFIYGDFDHDTRTKDFKKPKSRFAPIKIPFVIDKFTPHYLRHTYITNLYLAGVDILTAKEQAGHADISTTMGIYTHLDSVYKSKQIDKLNTYFEKRKKA